MLEQRLVRVMSWRRVALLAALSVVTGVSAYFGATRFDGADADEQQVQGSILEAIREQNARGSASVRWEVTTLADYASLADVVVAGQIISLDGFTPIRAFDGSVDEYSSISPQIAHFSVEVSSVLYGKLAGDAEGKKIPIVMVVYPPVPPAGETSVPPDWTERLTEMPLPVGELVISLIWVDNPVLELSGFFGEYSLTSPSRGLLSVGPEGFATPLGLDEDREWAAVTFPRGGVDDLAEALRAAVAACNAASACLTHELDASGDPIVGTVPTP